MIDGKRVLGIIPARGGSKGIPRKNLRLLAGKPLLTWTIEAARDSHYLDRVILSSEDEAIIAVARKWGCEVPFIRPAELARDDTPGIEPVLHAIHSIGGNYDYIVLLQPTSPLRTTEDIDGCISHCVRGNAPACVSVTAVAQHPSWMHTLDSQGRLLPLLSWSSADCRQDLPPVYLENGAVYVARTDYLMSRRDFITTETIAYIMPAARSVDIDTTLDLLLCAIIKAQENDT